MFIYFQVIFNVQDIEGNIDFKLYFLINIDFFFIIKI